MSQHEVFSSLAKADLISLISPSQTGWDVPFVIIGSMFKHERTRYDKRNNMHLDVKIKTTRPVEERKRCHPDYKPPSIFVNLNYSFKVRYAHQEVHGNWPFLE